MTETTAEPDTTTEDTPPDTPAQGSEPTPTKPETDWSAEAKKWEKRAKENKAAADKLATLEEANKTETERLNERASAAEKRAADAVTRIVKAEVKALAGSRLKDPGDAVRLLDLDQFEVDEDGNVDEAIVKAALDELIESKPYLALDASTSRRRPAGDIDQGVRGKPSADGRITTREQLNALTPKQIVEAKNKGLIDYAAITAKS